MAKEIDPVGNIHIFEGISIGNIFEESLQDICNGYDPDTFPIIGPLLKGSPAELVDCYKLNHRSRYADACHLCYEAHLALREGFLRLLVPDRCMAYPKKNEHG